MQKIVGIILTISSLHDLWCLRPHQELLLVFLFLISIMTLTMTSCKTFRLLRHFCEPCARPGTKSSLSSSLWDVFLNLFNSTRGRPRFGSRAEVPFTHSLVLDQLHPSTHFNHFKHLSSLMRSFTSSSITTNTYILILRDTLHYSGLCDFEEAQNPTRQSGENHPFPQTPDFLIIHINHIIPTPKLTSTAQVPGSRKWEVRTNLSPNKQS